MNSVITSINISFNGNICRRGGGIYTDTGVCFCGGTVPMNSYTRSVGYHAIR
ncbi:MAG: hypothetical protein GX236_08685 [Clostridiaceae bacterium]|nr:hypothetical protein [Clostridiaceae bacterium]